MDSNYLNILFIMTDRLFATIKPRYYKTSRLFSTPLLESSNMKTLSVILGTLALIVAVAAAGKTHFFLAVKIYFNYIKPI